MQFSPTLQSLPPSVPNISLSMLFSNPWFMFSLNVKGQHKAPPNIIVLTFCWKHQLLSLCDKLELMWNSVMVMFDKYIYIWLLMQLLYSLFQLIECITKFIEKEMGRKYVTPPTFDIAKSYDDSTCLCPLIFILSPGADPMAALRIFANKMGYSQNFQSISLGQGQVM